MPPALRDRYLLGERLGSGGMADVHRATDLTLERQVAVKVLRAAAGEASDRRRFVAEARTLASLSHRNLVMLLDAGIGDEDDRPFLVLELVEGQSLAETLADPLAAGPLSPGDAARIGAEVAAGLAYAHGRGIVHRDVKPANVLLSRDGRVKLADFGIARLIGDTVRHTRTGTAIGTAAYLSPEQVRGEDVTGAADVYALGLVLLEALTGQRAFSGSATEAALARLHRDPEVPADLPGGWVRLLTSMTAADQAARPAADEAARVLSAGVPPFPAAQAAGADEADADGAARTTLLTAPVATAVIPAAVGDEAPVAAGTGTPVLDRAGDALARLPGRVRRHWTALAPHQRGVAGAVLGLAALVVVAAVASGGASTPADPAPTPREPFPVDVGTEFLAPSEPGSGGDQQDQGEQPLDEPRDEKEREELLEQQDKEREKLLDRLQKEREQREQELKEGDEDD